MHSPPNLLTDVILTSHSFEGRLPDYEVAPLQRELLASLGSVMKSFLRDNLEGFFDPLAEDLPDGSGSKDTRLLLQRFQSALQQLVVSGHWRMMEVCTQNLTQFNPNFNKL